MCLIMNKLTEKRERCRLTAVALLKKTIEPCPKHNKKCNGFNGYNGNWIGFNGNYNGVYWCVMDYIGGMLNPEGEMPKNTLQKGIL